MIHFSSDKNCSYIKFHESPTNENKKTLKDFKKINQKINQNLFKIRNKLKNGIRIEDKVIPNLKKNLFF